MHWRWKLWERRVILPRKSAAKGKGKCEKRRKGRKQRGMKRATMMEYRCTAFHWMRCTRAKCAVDSWEGERTVQAYVFYSLAQLTFLLLYSFLLVSSRTTWKKNGSWTYTCASAKMRRIKARVGCFVMSSSRASMSLSLSSRFSVFRAATLQKTWLVSLF